MTKLCVTQNCCIFQDAPKESLHEISIGTFLLSTTSEIESFKGYWYTPLDENE